MKKAILGLIACIFCISVNTKGQQTNSFYDSIVQQVCYDSVFHNLQTLQSLGIKQVGSQSLSNTANWLVDKHQQWGYENIFCDSFVYNSDTICNIIITKTGTKYPNTFLIVDGHYDTYNGPGANDNGSGVSVILEIARLLKDVELEYSVKFIYFTAEELGLIGSQHYVSQTVVPQNMNILLVFNIDEVGGVNGMVNNIIRCERDEGYPSSNNQLSADYTDTLANCVALYSNLSTVITHAYGSDYMPFEDNGNVITGLYEYNESNVVHSINDSISRLDVEYVYQITKASVGATLYFARAIINDTVSIKNISIENSKFRIFPNPASEIINITSNFGDCCILSVQLMDVMGNIVLERPVYNKIANAKIQVNLANLQSGVYMLGITTNKGIQTSKIIVQ